MRVHTVGTQFHRDGGAFIVRREPLWTWLIHAATDLVCQLTCHHWCNSKPMHWAIKLSDRHAETFKIAAEDDQLHAFARWRGWRDWDTDDTAESD